MPSSPKFRFNVPAVLALTLGVFALSAMGCNDSDDVDPAIRDSARKQRESMSRQPSTALQPGQPGAPPAGTNPMGTSGGDSRR